MNRKVLKGTMALGLLLLVTLASQETLTERAVRDSLTGLFNRRHFEETLSCEIDRALVTRTPLSFILIDVDRFKSVNDTFGHTGGDVLLQQLATLMLQSVREGYVVCRYGGEEFAVLLPETPLGLAVECANRLRLQVRGLEPRLGDQALGSVTISAGVATAPEHAVDADRLLDAADRALYRAKNNGRDRVDAFMPEVAAKDAA